MHLSCRSWCCRSRHCLSGDLCEVMPTICLTSYCANTSDTPKRLSRPTLRSRHQDQADFCCRATDPAAALDRLEEILPFTIDEDVAIPVMLCTVPLLLYFAIRLLLWDYRERPEDLRDMKDADRWPAQPAKGQAKQQQQQQQRAYSWEKRPRSQQPNDLKLYSRTSLKEAGVAADAVLQAVRGAHVLLQSRCAHEGLMAGDCQSGPMRWHWTACMLGFAAPPKYPQAHRSACPNVSSDLTQRIVVPILAQAIVDARDKGNQRQ